MTGGQQPAARVDPAVAPTYLELYKLAVEMADRISARRATANSFFLTVNTGLVALLGSEDLRWYVAVAGIVFALAWWALLRSYRDLNAAKFRVILAMEKQLPAQIFGEEWSYLRPQEREPKGWLARYRELGSVERVIPFVFALIYVAEILRQVFE